MILIKQYILARLRRMQQLLRRLKYIYIYRMEAPTPKSTRTDTSFTIFHPVCGTQHLMETAPCLPKTPFN